MQTISWLTGGDGVSDYRPVFSPDGRAVLFERSQAGTRGTKLYILKLDGGEPEPFLPDSTLISQTRPDWGVRNNLVAFCGDGQIWLAKADGTDAHALAGTEGMIYPSWYPDGESMAVMVNNDNQPYTARIDRAGNPPKRLSPDSLYAGMPSVSQQHPSVLAFPASPATPPYTQGNNQIYVSTGPDDARKLDGKQGRAPWWSPDGSLLAFESNRETGGPYAYAIYVSTPDGSWQQRLTDPHYNTQHPKFSPDGTTIVLAGQRGGGRDHAPWSIGTIPFTAPSIA
jgi:Tol biopolymer transport system component